ncbi:mRNA triphosphatase CET1 [Zopfia rhizophila CBS 207.26]|uniref:mRNA-capping enzyme subunit beta n=1 Tax=Zopfia rhizophila CBS 207.26 TaxID=1314779 RepID=A0A6A6ENI2_9PEZI|nr:mRNA triphosphatase CET1 [Zopfia rhizophila CBS 207.26]
MDLKSIINPEPNPPPPPRLHQAPVPSPSPATSAAKLPTPPLSTHKPLPHKRKRHDPKPIWAVREHEVANDEHRERRQQSRPPPPTPRPQPPPNIQMNGPRVPSVASRELQGYERPISNDIRVYDEISRKVCDFIWMTVVDNAPLRHAVAESSGTVVEIEAKWGQIQDRHGGGRLQGMHETECIVRKHVLDQMKFESTMSLEQHKKMNQYLNKEVTNSKQPGAMRAEVNYKHLRESDMFYELDPAGFDRLPPLTKAIIAQSPSRHRVRVTRDQKSGVVLRKIIKHRIANLEISSPQTEWDYRISINIEIQYPGPVEELTPATEPGRSVDSMERKKDRVSYSWLGAYQVDLTQVVQSHGKNHELELELDSGMIIEAGERIKRGEENDFESLVAGMMNNLRVLSREITAPV